MGDKRHVVIVGSLTEGMTDVVGPFKEDAAHDYAEKLFDSGVDIGIHVVEMSEP